jgi:7-cyano-7-deazaguanine synthase
MLRGTDLRARSEPSALVLFSGGQDSTTCLAWALERYERVETIGFDYRQRNRIELAVRPPVRAALTEAFPRWAARLGEDHVLDLAALAEISDSAMTRDVAIATRADGLPNTFVPGRNLLFLTFAAALAYRRGLQSLVAGMCETDYSGYPDCRDETIKALGTALNLGMATQIVIETPLMWLDKPASWRLARDLGGERLIDILREDTHTCYEGDRSHHHEWGWGCGECPACKLRASGYNAFRAGSA